MTMLNSRLQLALLNKKKGRNLIEKGFTLVELMIVVAIVAILSAVAIPQFTGVRNRAEAKAMIGEAVGIAKECASLVIEGQTGSTVTPPGGGTAVTCDGTGTATIKSKAFKDGTGATCLTDTGVSADKVATLSITTNGAVSCTLGAT
jgi:type IV pilus assembly protein PilA